MAELQVFFSGAAPLKGKAAEPALVALVGEVSPSTRKLYELAAAPAAGGGAGAGAGAGAAGRFGRIGSAGRVGVAGVGAADV